MSLSALNPRLSPEQMSGLLKADQEEDYSGFFDRVHECATAGIELTTIEIFLRKNNCQTYLIACEHKKSALRLFPPPQSTDGKEKPYLLYIAMHPEAREEARLKVKSIEENLKNLANTGFI
jgi:hypothetical protein